MIYGSHPIRVVARIMTRPWSSFEAGHSGPWIPRELFTGPFNARGCVLDAGIGLSYRQ
jgi:hypothetical protein